jgi:hypothetical protein
MPKINMREAVRLELQRVTQLELQRVTHRRRRSLSLHRTIVHRAENVIRRVDQRRAGQPVKRAGDAERCRGVGRIYVGDFRQGQVMDLPSRLPSGADRPFLAGFLGWSGYPWRLHRRYASIHSAPAGTGFGSGRWGEVLVWK